MSLAESARTLLANESIGALATHSTRQPGWPFASVMPYALMNDGSPLFLISAMAIHTQNLIADPRASLLVMQSGSAADPLNIARVTVLGNVQRINADDAMRAAYLGRHPNARQWIDFADFAFFRLQTTQMYFVGGFGVMGWIEP